MNAGELWQLSTTGQRKRDHRSTPDKPYGAVRREAGQAGRFGTLGEAGFGQLGQESADLRGQLGRYASGQDSLSAEQLRQGLQQNVAGQQAMAASARPGMAPMGARNAMMNAGRMGQGLAGQQAMAGIAERQSAVQSLGNMLGQQRQLELQAALGGRGQALSGYQSVMDDQTRREALKKQGGGSGWGMLGGALAGGGLGFAVGGPAGAAAGARLGAEAGQADWT